MTQPTVSDRTDQPAPADEPRLSLSTEAARNLATTTKTRPMMQAISSRWLLRKLPWVEVSGGVYRVNRRLTYAVGDGRVTFLWTGSRAEVVPAELAELPTLRGFAEADALGALARRCEQREYAPGDIIAEQGAAADGAILIAHGKVDRIGAGKYGEPTHRGVLADGQFTGDPALTGEHTWPDTLRAITAVTVLYLPRTAFEQVAESSPALRDQVVAYRSAELPEHNKQGEAAIRLASGHSGEPVLPGTFVDYELNPREYELSVAQTILRVHTRVADLYNDPMNQVEQQLRLTIEALRERQELEMVNNPEFGLLHNADPRQRIPTRSGPPTPDDMDELLTRRRGTRLFFAHPRAIAAFGRECSKRGLYPTPVEINGHHLPAWRGVPIYPCGKIPITPQSTTSIMAMRLGEEDQGVVALRQTGLPDEVQPGLSVRFMGINEQAIISYLVSTYYSAAVLVPDALGILEDVDIAQP